METRGGRIIIALAAIVLAVGLMFGTTRVAYYHYAQCDETVAFESISPDGQWLAAAMERRCSDDSPLVIHVNMRRYEDVILTDYLSQRADYGDVFAVEQGDIDTQLALKWNGPRQLTIQCLNCRLAGVRMQKGHWGPITLRYQLPSR